MKIQINVIGIIIIFLLLGLSFYLGGIRYRNQRDNVLVRLSQTSNEVSMYKVKLSDKDRFVAEQEAIIISNWKAIKSLEEEKERLRVLNIKNVQVIGKLNSEIEVLNKALSITDTLTQIVIDTVWKFDDNCLPLPATLVFNDQWSWSRVDLGTESGKISFGLTDVNFNITIGDRGGLFKQNKTVVVADTPNPYLDVKSMSFVVVKEEKKWHKRNIVWLLGGVALGGLLL